jgi:hypothetical protein
VRPARKGQHSSMTHTATTAAVVAVATTAPHISAAQLLIGRCRRLPRHLQLATLQPTAPQAM